MTGTEHPLIQTAIPGPVSRVFVDRLAAVECPAITARRSRRAATLGLASDDPVVWAEAVGANVLDVDGNRFVDLTAGFGVAAVGHRNPMVVEAATTQLNRLIHAMGDAYPDPTRIQLMERLCELTGMDRVILGSSGSDAVEAALKTARIASGKDGVIAFSGGYHGLSYGALAVGQYKAQDFRGPFEGQVGRHVRALPFGALPGRAELAGVGAVLVEPIQGRGGMRPAPEGWLSRLHARVHEAGALLILDEIYTGFGRTGDWFAFQHEHVTPDLLCLGKGMAGGFPISACLGRREVMDAWGASRGEALHTQTFLGHPVGSAMSLASISEVERLLPSVRELSDWLTGELLGRGLPVRGRGLLLGVKVRNPLALSRALLGRGYIALPAGDDDPVLALTPPLTITREQLEGLLAALDEELG